MNVTLKDLRKATPLKKYYDGPLCVLICRYLSPIISIPAIRNNIHPNVITLLMVISGIIGGILFMLPVIELKAISILFYILWFVFDCSDGEVARFTNTFSKYGKELDWMAHLACHSLLVFGILLNYILKEDAIALTISLLSLAFIASELINRCLIAMNFVECIESNNTSISPSLISRILHYPSNQLFYFPNFVLFYPILFVVDDILNLSVAKTVYIVWASLYVLYTLLMYFRILRLMYIRR